ncbi:hypothetical protein [Nocardioides sp. R-C-SC26]|uniref:hypothetical protein n=1 Tax=Nocardioides sp. R-C-SC26 TaxID=2870414 RepID=UPI001E62DCF8|nr:hypothetical protein [Nocardioides sp. R-C-SC26]
MSTLFAWPDGVLTRRKVTECALARLCGACGRPLGRPIAFLGDAGEVARNEFHSPPLHTECLDRARTAAEAEAEVVLTAGYDFVRPTADDTDPEPRFRPLAPVGTS